MPRLQEWAAFYRREPFGMAWWQTAALTNVLANLWGRKKGQPAFKLRQWLPVRDGDGGDEPSADEMCAQMMAIARRHNAKLDKQARRKRKPRRDD